MCAPLLDDLFLQNVRLVKFHENPRHSRYERRLFDTNSALNTAKQRLLMTFGRYNLRARRLISES